MRFYILCFFIFCPLCQSKNLSILDWVKYFETQEINIIYSSDYLSEYDVEKKILLKYQTIDEFSEELLQQSLLLIKVDDTTYVMNHTQSEIDLSSGILIKLLDSVTQEAITKFSIITNNTKYHSNNSKILLIDLLTSEQELTIAAEGYYSNVEIAKVVKDQYTSYTYKLKPAPVKIDDIIVTASKISYQSPISSQNSLSKDEIKQSLSLASDPLRASHTIAGNTSNGISGKSKTRGGLENESIILLDNYVLRNPYHFKNFHSLFSTINISTVNNIDFYSGVFPIEFGGRLSSVLDIQSSDNIDQFKHDIAIDFINSSYTFRKSSANFSQQFQAAFRSGGQFINNEVIRPEFDDAYFTYSQEINEYWKSSQHLLVSRDEISVESLDDSFGEIVNTDNHDQNLWLQWNYNNYLNNRFNLQLYSSRKHDYRFGQLNDTNSQGMLSEDILTQYSGIKFQQTVNLNEDLSIKFGVDFYTEKTKIINHTSWQHSSDFAQLLGLHGNQSRDFSFDNKGNAIDGFVNTRYRLNDSLIFDLGIRFEHKEWIDQTINSPRFNMSYFINEDAVVRFAVGRHQQSQYIDELLLEDQLPSYFKPTSADIVVLEFDKQISSNLNFRSEVYLKKYSSSHPYYENLFNSYHFLPELHYDRIRIAPEDSEARGIEFTLNGNTKQLKWTAAFAYSDVDDIINNQEVPRSWDQHNALKIQLSHPLSYGFFNNWNIYFNANYHSGWAKTSIVEENRQISISDRNQDSFDNFYQFDLKIDKTRLLNRGIINYSFQINNLLNTRNTCCIDYSLEDNQLISEEKSWLPISPNFSINYQWN